MSSENLINPILLNFINEKKENKFKKKTISLRNIFLYYLLIFGVCLANYFTNLKLIDISNNLKNNTFFEEGTNNNFTLVAESYPIKKANNDKGYINIYLQDLKFFLNLNLQILIFFFLLKLITLIALHKISKKYRNNKVISDKKDMKKKNLKNVHIDNKNSETSNNQRVNNIKDNVNIKKIENLYKKFKTIKTYLLNFISILLAFQTVFQIYLLRILLISTYSAKIFIHSIPYFHMFIIIIFIYFVCFNYIFNILGFLLGIIFILAFIKNEIINVIANKPEILLYEFSGEICFLFSALVLVCSFNYKINLNNRLNFIKYQHCKLNCIKTNETLLNLNSGLITIGNNMQLNYNKKFSQIFTNLINEITRNEKPNDDAITTVKTLKMVNHLDEKIREKQTAKFNEKPNSHSTKFYFNNNILKPEDHTFFQESNKLNCCGKSKKKDSLDFEKGENSDLFLLLFFFDKDCIQLNNNLESNIKNFFEEYLIENNEAVKFFTEYSNHKPAENNEKSDTNKNSSFNKNNINYSSKKNLKYQNSNEKLQVHKKERSLGLLKNKVKIFEENIKNDNLNSKHKGINNNISHFNLREKNEKDKQNIDNKIIDKELNQIRINENDKFFKGIINENLEINNKQLKPNINIHRDESILNNSNSNFIINNGIIFLNNQNLLENCNCKSQTPTFKIELKEKKKNVNCINRAIFCFCKNINNQHSNSKRVDIIENNINQIKLNEKDPEYYLNTELLSFLEKKKIYLNQLINIVKTMKSQTDEFIYLFTYKKKLEYDLFVKVLHIEVLLRYNKFSDKIEFLFNDLSEILDKAKSKVQKKIKKIFLNKFSHEFRNPILNIIQLVKKLKKKSFEKKPELYKIRSTISNLLTKDFTNTKENFNNIKPKESLDNSQNSEKTRLIANVEFNSFAIYKEILEKENFFRRNSKLSNTSSISNEDYLNLNLNINPYEIMNSRTGLERQYLQKLKNFTLIKDNEIANNHKSQTFKNKNVYLNSLNFVRKGSNKNLTLKENLKSTQANTNFINNDYSKIKDTFCQNKDFKSNLSNEIFIKNFSKSTIDNIKHKYNDEEKYNIKTDLDNNSTINSKFYNSNFINSLEYKLKSFNNEIIFNLNKIKYICNNLNFIINDFDYISQMDFYNSKNQNKSEFINYQNNIKIQSKTDRIENLISTKIDIHKLIKKLSKIFKSRVNSSEKNIDFILEIDESVPELIKSSSDKITQILFNLLSNSLKFTKVGLIKLKINYEINNSKLIFKISDTGIGIKQDFLKNIFKPFHKIKDNKNNIDGLGIGMFIVKSYIESLNGEIHLESKEMQYTIITFYIKAESVNPKMINCIDKLEEKKTISSPFLEEKDLNLKYINENIAKSSIKRKSCKNVELRDDHKSNKSISPKLKGSVEAENISLIENFSYEENNNDIILKYERKKNISLHDNKELNENKNNSISKFSNLTLSDNHNKLQHLPKTFAPKNGLKKYSNSNDEIPIFYLKKSKTKEACLKNTFNIYSKLLKINMRSNYYENTCNEIKTSLNIKPKKYLLFINREDTIKNYGTSRSSNSNINTFNSKSIEGNCIEENTKIPSKFSNYGIKNYFRSNNVINSNNNIKNDIDVYIENPKQKETNSNSSLWEISNNINDQSQNSNNNSIFNLSGINSSRLERNSSKNIKKKNSVNSNKITQSPQKSSRSYKKYKISSGETINFAEKYNFNYNDYKSLNPILYQSNRSESDLNESNFNNSNLSIIKNSKKSSQTHLTINNPENNRIKSLYNTENPNSVFINNSNNRKKSNLRLYKIEENKKILSYLASDKTNLNNKNTDFEILSRKFTSKIRILVVDDEKLIRQSNINLITKYFKYKPINFQVYECEDGFDCLNYIYQAKLVGINFDYIITDQTMNFITGTLLSDFIWLLVEHKIIKEINMFLLTSYSSSLFDKHRNRFKLIFSKPLKMDNLEIIFKDL